MRKSEWIELGFSEEDAEKLSKLAMIGIKYHYNDIDEAVEGFKEINIGEIIDKFKHMPLNYTITTDNTLLERIDKLIEKIKEKPYGEWK